MKQKLSISWQTTVYLFCLLLLTGTSLQVAAQKGDALVNGIVKSETGSILANVTVKATNITTGTERSTVTNDKGVFRFNDLVAAGKYSFTFSFVGYETQVLSGYVLKKGASTSLEVKLKENQAALSQIVVIGYGSAQRKDITGAVTTTTSENFNKGVFNTPAQLLQGKVAGLNITSSGDPNGTPAVILRGASTLREGEAQQPFYVIDGVPGASIDLVAPGDIASVDVLKDAASTAIYGTRAANGVIMITTKRARSGQMQVNYDNYFAFEKVSKQIDMASADQLRSYLKANGKVLAPTDDDTASTNWQKTVMRTGFSQNHNLSVGGGTDQTVFGASMNYYSKDGIMLGSSQKRVSGRMNLEQKALNNKLLFSFSLADANTSKQLLYNQDNVFYQMMRYLPTHVIYNADGTFREDRSRTNNYNPLGLIKTSHDNETINVLQANAGLRADLPFGIQGEVRGSIQLTDDNTSIYIDRASVVVLNANGQAQRSDYKSTRKVLESFFNWGHNWYGHSLKLMAGYSWQQDKTGDGFQTTTQGFVSDATGANNLALGHPPLGYLPNYGNVSMTELRMISFFGRLNYNFGERYLLQASLRRDGSSAFGTDSRWGMFPSVSAAWRINREAFMSHQHIFSDLKLRVGYGVTGNSLGFDPLISILRYGSTGGAYYNGQFIAGIGPSQNANPNLRWEKTGMLNIGADMSFLKGRLNVTADVYDKETKDLIWTYPVSSTLYYVNTLTANVGSMSNKGVELTISGSPVKTAAFEWTSSLNLAHNKNKVKSLSNDFFKLDYVYTSQPGGLGQSSTYIQIIQSGYPIGQFYTLRYAGKDKDGISQFYDKNGKLTITPQTADQQYLGDAQPKLQFGFNNSFRYKNFDFNFFLRGVTGNKIMNATLANLNVPIDATNHNIPVYTLQESYADVNANKYSDRWLENGAYLRMDNATLGYTFRGFHKSVHAIRVYVSVSNLFTITSYRGIDPEINLGGITPGVDNNNFYPKTRAFMSGLHIDL